MIQLYKQAPGAVLLQMSIAALGEPCSGAQVKFGSRIAFQVGTCVWPLSTL